MNDRPKVLPRISFSQGTLLVEGIGREVLGRIAGDGGLVWDRRVRTWRGDASRYAAVCRLLNEAAIRFQDDVAEWSAVEWPKVDIHTLRAEQQEAVRAWSVEKRGCVIMPTGTGKTEVALEIMHQTATSTLVVAPVRDLMYQWHRRMLAGLGYDAGIVGDNVFRVKPVSVTTYDSACLHMDKFGNRFGLIIFDECHHLPGPIRRDAARMCAAPMRLGLTATPQRSDGRQSDLPQLIGPIIYEMPISEAAGRTLADYDITRIAVHLSGQERGRYDRLSRQVKTYMAERRKDQPRYSWEDLCSETGHSPEARRALKAYLAKKSIEDRAEEKLRILEDVFRLHVGEPCLVFAGSNAMARDVSRRFLIPCLLSHCGKAERIEVLQGLEGGSYPALVANQVLDEGVDLPEVKVAIVIGGTASTRQAKQRLGRILRRSGNAKAKLYEIVTAETNETLRSRKRRKSDAYTKTRRFKKT